MTILAKFFKPTSTHYAFGSTVLIILSLISFNQMTWANTRRSIASMQNVFWPDSMFGIPCDMMSIKVLPSFAKVPISSSCARSEPKPAGIGFINFSPKVLKEHNVISIPQGSVTNVTATAPCNEDLWRRIYHPKRLVVKQACISVSGTLVDAGHGRNSDGCRHEADGDAHCWLQLDKGEEGLLNAKNRSMQSGNLVIEPICRYRVTQADAVEACKDWHQDLALPPPGSRVRVTGAYVLDTQHGHMEIHPISAIEVLK